MRDPYSTAFDVSKLPTMQPYGTNPIEVGHFVSTLLRETVNSGIIDGRYKDTTSLGFAMASPDDNPWTNWNDPESLVWLTASWGPEKNRRAANAARMLRAAARLGEDTLGCTTRASSPFENVITPDVVNVEKVQVAGDSNHSTFLWGDLPAGGGVTVQIGEIMLVGAVDGLTPEENHIVARHILDEVALLFLKLDNSS